MSRKSKLQVVLETESKRNYVITSAIIKDGLCSYTYEIIEGVNAGDTHSVKGSGIVDDDMSRAFSTFSAHLACIDDTFKHSGTEVESIDNMHSHEFSFLYSVNGFKIKGGKDNESIILLGNKSISSSGGRIEIASPRIPLDNLSSYEWYNELKLAADNAREEVTLYKEGKNTPVVTEDVVEDMTSQPKLNFETADVEQE